MRRLPAALAVTALFAVLLAPSASGRVRHLTLHYLTMNTSSHEINRGPKSFGPGDAFTFTERLLVRGGIAGSDRVRCDVLPRTRFFCRGRLFFREGTVAVSGAFPPSTGVSYLHVTGGTRRFRGQRGTLGVADRPHDRTYLTLTLR